MRPPFLFKLYTAATTILVPFAAWFQTRKLRSRGVDVLRAHEVLGHATIDRSGSGPLIWFHAASVGESLSVLSLITAMGEQLPRARFLITSGTATSANVIKLRMPPRTDHQFAPLDAPGPVGRFLDHWRPNAAVFVESELWPQMLSRTHARGTRMVLVNARLSKNSQAAWQKRPQTARFVLNCFDLILTQNDEMAQAMVDMHAPNDRVARGFNLKSLSDPLPKDPSVLAQMRTSLKGRPVWVAASTHEGEEELVLQAHENLLSNHPDLLLILAPRHPERSAKVAEICHSLGFSTAIRSHDQMPQHEPVYLADTLGELGNWYALTKVIFLGGSLFPIGGHNPFEVAQAGAFTLSGPHVANFAESYTEMTNLGAAEIVDTADALSDAVNKLLTQPEVLDAGCRAARDHVRGKDKQRDVIATRLIKALKLEDQMG